MPQVRLPPAFAVLRFMAREGVVIGLVCAVYGLRSKNATLRTDARAVAYGGKLHQPGQRPSEDRHAVLFGRFVQAWAENMTQGRGLSTSKAVRPSSATDVHEARWRAMPTFHGDRRERPACVSRRWPKPRVAGFWCRRLGTRRLPEGRVDGKRHAEALHTLASSGRMRTPRDFSVQASAGANRRLCRAVGTSRRFSICSNSMGDDAVTILRPGASGCCHQPYAAG